MDFACFPADLNAPDLGGRPTKFTPDLLEKLAEAIAAGMPDQYACDRVGIDVDTLADWKRTQPGFSGVLNHARAERMLTRLNRIDVGESGWQGTAWILERRWGEHFARPELQINMNVNAVVEHQVNMIPEAELHRMLDLTRDVEAVVTPVDEQPALTDVASDPEGTNAGQSI
jgi:hypothetical protein